MILLKWRASLGLARIESMDWHEPYDATQKTRPDPEKIVGLNNENNFAERKYENIVDRKVGGDKDEIKFWEGICVTLPI